MNKLFTRISVLALGSTMAFGAFALANKGEIIKARAATYLAYSLDGTEIATGDPVSTYNGYANPSPVLQNEVNWTVEANTTLNPWRVGGKSLNAVDRVIASQDAVTTQNVSKVIFKTGTLSNANLVVNSISMVVSTAANGGGTVISDLSTSFAASSNIEFTRPDAVDWSNRFFTFKANLTNSKTTNYYFQFKGIDFQYDVSVLEPDTITVTGNNTVSVGNTVTLTASATKSGSSTGVNQNVVWSSNAEQVATVSSDGVVTGVSNGTATISAKAENDNTVVGSLEITVSGEKTNDTALVILPDDVPGAYGDTYLAIHGVYCHAKQIMKNAGSIQIQKTNGLFENVAAFYYAIKTIELHFTEGKSQGTGYTVSVSSGGGSFNDVSGDAIRTDKGVSYTVSLSNQRYVKIVGPTTGTLYLDEIIIGLGNETETKTLALATTLNGLLDSECTGESDSDAITASTWSNIASTYASGDADAKAGLQEVTSASYYEINLFLSRYDYIVAHYGYSNFLNRSASSLRVVPGAVYNTDVTFISLIAVMSLVTFAALIVVKKKRHN